VVPKADDSSKAGRRAEHLDPSLEVTLGRRHPATVAVVQDAAVPCNCPRCGASLVIFPASLLSQVGEKTVSVEAELDFAGALAGYRDGTERRYPIADVDGDFTCPACRAQANVGDVEPLI